MINVWLLFLFCILLSNVYEKGLTRDAVKYSKKTETTVSLLSFGALSIVLILFAGLRTVMNDTGLYIISFQRRVPEGFDKILSIDWTIGANPLFQVYQIILKTVFGANGQVYIFITSIIVVGSYLFFIRKYSPNFSWSIFTLVGFTVYAFTMAAIKQTLAIAIGVWAVSDFLDKRYFRAIIRLAIACLFHPYVFVIAVLAFLCEDVWKRRTIFILLGTVVFVFSFSTIVNLFVSISDSIGDEYHLESFTGNGVGIARIISYFAVPALSIFVKDQINEKHNRLFNICINASIVSACIMLIAGFGGAVLIGRMPSYFDLLSCISVAVVFSCCEFKNKKVFEALYVVLILLFYYTYYNKYNSGVLTEDFYRHASLFSLFGG